MVITVNGELDLELYTISIIRLNTAFSKLEDSEDEAIELFNESANDLQALYEDILNDLDQDEVNFGEYYLFFENGKQTFPEYISALGAIENKNLTEPMNKLINIFNNLNKIAGAFPAQNEMIKWMKP